MYLVQHIPPILILKSDYDKNTVANYVKTAKSNRNLKEVEEILGKKRILEGVASG